MKSLIAPIEDFIKVERTKLAADVSAGNDVSLTLENNDGLVDNDYLVIGEEGAEPAELQQINAVVSGATNAQVAILDRAHKKGESVTKYRYNKRKFYGCTTESGTYSELTSDGSPVDIQPDDPQGAQLEYTGAEGYIYFKATYYNSEELLETDVDDAQAVQADDSLRYAGIFQIKKQAGIHKNPYINDGQVEAKRKQAESEINSAIFARYSLPLSEVPGLITRICILLAGGYIDYEEYQADGEGKKWLGEARALIKAIQTGKQRLINSDGAELSVKADSSQLSGYPDDSIEEGDDDYRKFQIGDKF